MNYPFKSLLPSWHLSGKKVLVRADLNVPRNNNTILDDFRLQAALPTINLILKKSGKIVLATHLGRPEGKYTNSLSTKVLIPWFEKQGYSITYCPTLEEAQSLNKDIILLENLRFFHGEQNHDLSFAQELASLADFYVNDAWGLVHRADTSITLVPRLFGAHKSTIGLLIEHELEALQHLVKPQHPFVVIAGGGKVTTKLPMLHACINKADTILLCPALVFTFMKALNKEVGDSLIDESALKESLTLIQEAKKKNVSLIFPRDYQIEIRKEKKLVTVAADAIPTTGMGISIGPKTLDEFSKVICTAKTIFFNAAMGFADRPSTMVGLHHLLNLVAQSPAFTVVGGGDSVSAVRKFGLEKKINFLSTGGGSTLAYMSGEPLPGLISMDL